MKNSNIMRNILPILVLSILVFTHKESSAQKVGIGGEVSFINLGLGQSAGSGLSVPIWFENILIEPQISISSTSNSDEDSKFKNSITALAVGVNYGFLVENDFRAFAGLNLGTLREKDLSKFNDEKETEVDSRLLLGLQIGGEYFISDRFSLGMTLGYYITTYQDDNDTRYTSAGIGNSAKFRFYPFK